jgi:hypothetical protein
MAARFPFERTGSQEMNVYVVGAGVSHQVCYPLGGDLFSETGSFIRAQGASLDRRDFAEEWPELCRWLERNPDPLVHAAYITGNIENILTALDFARILRNQSHAKAYRSLRESGPAGAADAEADSLCIDRQTDLHLRYSCTLRWALVRFFQRRHHDDLESFQSGGAGWLLLRRFGERICPGDVVITFNYDASLERVLLEQGKWNPSDGYGLGKITLVPRGSGARPLPLKPSAVGIFHLHGSFGWYTNFALSSASGTRISLSTDFLDGLGIGAEDVTWKDSNASSNPSSVDPILICPSFFKDYDDRSWYGAIAELWRNAAEALRAADHIYVVGYSLPAGDTAALTFLVTNCDRKRVTIINNHKSTCVRLRQLLGPWSGLLPNTGPLLDFEEWVERDPGGAASGLQEPAWRRSGPPRKQRRPPPCK